MSSHVKSVPTKSAPEVDVHPVDSRVADAKNRPPSDHALFEPYIQPTTHPNLRHRPKDASMQSMQRTWEADIFAWDTEPPAPYTSQDYTLYHENCEQFYRTIETNSVDLLLTDPPYGITRNGWDTTQFRAALAQTWQQWTRIVKNNGAIVVMAASPFDKILAMSNLSLYRYEWIWNKNKATGHLNSKKLPLKAHENILVFYRRPPTYHIHKTLGHLPSHAVNPAIIAKPAKLRCYGHHNSNGNSGGDTQRYPRTVLNIPVHNNDSQDKWHPTQKPVKLMEFFIRTYTDKGHTVFDPFMGSGTTGIAALKCARKFIGIEIDEEYYNRARERLLSCSQHHPNPYRQIPLFLAYLMKNDEHEHRHS